MAGPCRPKLYIRMSTSLSLWHAILVAVDTAALMRQALMQQALMRQALMRQARPRPPPPSLARAR